MILLLTATALAQSIEEENEALRNAVHFLEVQAADLKRESAALRDALESRDRQIQSLERQLELKDDVIASFERQLEAERRYSTDLEATLDNARRDFTVPKAVQFVLYGAAFGYAANDFIRYRGP